MLVDLEEKGLDHIVGWQPNNLCFRVRNPLAFLEIVIPMYFPCQSKIKSFQRQLGLYGFTRIRAGPHLGAYAHPDFRRYDRQSCLNIVRVDRKTKKHNRSFSWPKEQKDNAVCLVAETKAAQYSSARPPLISDPKGSKPTSSLVDCFSTLSSTTEATSLVGKNLFDSTSAEKESVCFDYSIFDDETSPNNTFPKISDKDSDRELSLDEDMFLFEGHLFLVTDFEPTPIRAESTA